MNWSLTTITVQFRSQVTMGLKLVAQRARAKQNRAIGSSWRWGWQWRWSGVRFRSCTWRWRCLQILGTWTALRTQETSSLSKKVHWERSWCRLRSSTGSRNRTGVGGRNAVDGTQRTWAAMMLNHSPGTLWISENLSHENLFQWESLAPTPHDVVNLKGTSTFSSCSHWTKSLKLLQDPGTNMRPKTQIWATIWSTSTFLSPKLISLVLLEMCESLFPNIYRLLFAILPHKKVTARQKHAKGLIIFDHRHREQVCTVWWGYSHHRLKFSGVTGVSYFDIFESPRWSLLRIHEKWCPSSLFSQKN